MVSTLTIVSLCNPANSSPSKFHSDVRYLESTVDAPIVLTSRIVSDLSFVVRTHDPAPAVVNVNLTLLIWTLLSVTNPVAVSKTQTFFVITSAITRLLCVAGSVQYPKPPCLPGTGAS